jgi:hypothetical protein
MAQNQESTTDAPSASNAAQRVQLGIRLQPAGDSDKPVFANFTVVQGAPGTVFVDFGFLEPNVLPALARQVKSGGKMPESINGRLACRVALGVDTAVQLAQQLGHYLTSLQAEAQQQAAKIRDK